MIANKNEFLAYIDRLPIADTTKSTYCNWVRRIDEHLPEQLSDEAVTSEADVRRLADSMPKNKFAPEHIKDVRCIIRYYLKFITHQAVITQQNRANEEDTYFPINERDARERVEQSILIRRGQRQFREKLLKIYKNRCCITGTNAVPVLEAAHIQPYSKDGTNFIKNGLLLRSDIHVLFDLFLISINPDLGTIFCDTTIQSITPYSALHGSLAQLPSDARHSPNKEALKQHYKRTESRHCFANHL